MNNNSRSMNMLLMAAMMACGNPQITEEDIKEEGLKTQTADDIIEQAGEPTEDELTQSEEELLKREEVEEYVAEAAWGYV